MLLLLKHKSENILKFSNSSCIIKSCLHSNASFNLITISFATSIVSISSLMLFFAYTIYKFLIGSSNFHVSSYSSSIFITYCSLIDQIFSILACLFTTFNNSSLNSLITECNVAFISFSFYDFFVTKIYVLSNPSYTQWKKD